MNGTHATGITLGALIGFVAANFGWHVSQDEALIIGGAAAAVGGTLAHVVTGPGLVPALKRAVNGPPAPPSP